MSDDVDARISRLLDRLERPDLTDRQRRVAERQLEALQGLESKVMQT